MKPNFLRLGGKTLALVFTFMSIHAAHAAETKAPIGASSMTVVEDKETGELRRATAKEVAEMNKNTSSQKSLQQSKLKTSKDVGKMKYHKNGMRSMELDESHFKTLRATQNPDGTLTLHHEEVKPKQPKTQAAEQ